MAGDVVTALTKVICGAVATNAPGACILDRGHEARGERHQDIEGLRWAYDFKYGRPDVYEVTWMSGHVERVLAHQVTYPHAGMVVAGEVFGLASEAGAPRVRMHAEIDGNWCLTLAAREEDIRTLRLVTGGEPVPGGEVR